ncbi:MAG: polysaccharide export protein [Flammeovirgaceae bacterium]|nr:polysaccharide export protein [Flammeovirgaceae bacterium]
MKTKIILLTRHLIFLPFVLLIYSCVPHQSLIYLNEQELPKEVGDYPKQHYKIRPLDILNIDLKNPDGTTAGYFNGGTNNSQQSQNINQSNAAQFYFKGYTVNDSGYIKLPLIGNQFVEGLTTDEISNILETKLDEFIKFPSVNVKLANFRISVLGEVNNPGNYYFFENEVTLFQALSNAGDMTDFGDRTKIKLVRKLDSGAKVVHLDLSKIEQLTSEYYFLQPHDVLYVEPVKAKVFNINIRPFSLVLSVASISLVVLSLVISNRN